MIIYNITTLVCWPIHEEWKVWMKTEFLPELLTTKLFTNYQMVRLMEVNEDDGPTYAVQLYLHDAKHFDEYKEKHLEKFLIKEKNMWGEYTTSFASLMEVVN